MIDKLVTGIILDEQVELSTSDLCQACSQHAEWIVELVEEGILEPSGRHRSQWRFPGTSLQRARTAMRLQRDLGINLAGVALALQLMDEIDSLRSLASRLGPSD